MPKSAWYFLLFCFLSCSAIAQHKTDKVQNTLELIKKMYRQRDNDQDYITDGERIVWVKFYRIWTPDDLGILKKENPAVWQFFIMLCEHNRFDLLEQVLPNYYRNKGGVKSFASGIMRIASEKRTGVILFNFSTNEIVATRSLFKKY